MAMQSGEQVQQAAEAIVGAWHEPMLRVPTIGDGFRPRDLGQAYEVQAAVSRNFGAIGGWRICRPDTQVSRACAPLPLASIRPAPTRLSTEHGMQAFLQPVLCFRLQRDLPDYDAFYSRGQLRSAIGSVHPGIVMLQPGAGNHCSLDPLNAIAHGCDQRYLIYGAAVSGWHEIDTCDIVVSVLQHGVHTRCHDEPTVAGWLERQSLLWGHAKRPVATGAPGGIDDPIDLLCWLANEGARWAGGLAVGQWIAVGLGIDELRVPADAPARIVFGGLGAINLQFA